MDHHSFTGPFCGSEVSCACTAYLQAASATSACGACGTVFGGSPCPKKVRVAAQSIIRQDMTSSPPLSPHTEKWIDACLTGMGEVDGDVGQKRLRPQLPVVAETLLPLEESELASIPSHGSASITVHSHGSCVPETCVVYGTQHSQDLQQHGGGAAGPATGPTAAESDSDSDDGDVGSELPASLVDMQSLAGIPSEWAASTPQPPLSLQCSHYFFSSCTRRWHLYCHIQLVHCIWGYSIFVFDIQKTWKSQKAWYGQLSSPRVAGVHEVTAHCSILLLFWWFAESRPQRYY